MSQSRRLWSRAKSFVWPVLGFGLGWSAYSVADERKWISPSLQHKLILCNLRAQLAIQSALPSSLAEKYCVPSDVIRSTIERIKLEGPSDSDCRDSRMTFEQVLRECRVTEQIEYLEDHIREDIPYFYIADLFHAWANIHAQTYMPTVSLTREQDSGVDKTNAVEAASQRNTGDQSTARSPTRTASVPRSAVAATPDFTQDDEFDTPALCSLLWEKMQTNVIPFDVGVRVLSVLAVRSRRNAHRLSHAIHPQFVLDGYADYQRTVCERASRVSGGDEVASPDEVAAATLTLLCALNDDRAASVGLRLQRWWGWMRGDRASYAVGSAALPIASQLSAPVWCASFAAPGGQKGRAASVVTGEQLLARARVFESSMSTFMKCTEYGSLNSE